MNRPFYLLEERTKMNFKAVIFDMDGVIFDSERVYIDCYKEIEDDFHVKDTEEVCKKCIGITSAETVRILHEHYGEDFPVDKFYGAAGEVFRRKYEENGLPMKPGVTELLKWLKDKGISTAIASSTKTEVVKQELKDAGILIYFDKIIGGDMVSRSKPNPDIFLKAAETLQVDTDEAFVIEDSFNGIRAAHAADIKAIMVPDILQPDEEIRGKAFKVLDSLLEVRDYFNSNVGETTTF